MIKNRIEHTISIDNVDYVYLDWILRENSKIIEDFNIKNIRLSSSYFQPDIFDLVLKLKRVGYNIWFDVKIYENYKKYQDILLYLKHYLRINCFTILCIDYNINYVKDLVSLCKSLDVTPILTSFYCFNSNYMKKAENIICYLTDNISIDCIYVPFNLALKLNSVLNNVSFYIPSVKFNRNDARTYNAIHYKDIKKQKYDFFERNNFLNIILDEGFHKIKPYISKYMTLYDLFILY